MLVMLLAQFSFIWGPVVKHPQGPLRRFPPEEPRLFRSARSQNVLIKIPLPNCLPLVPFILF